MVSKNKILVSITLGLLTALSAVSPARADDPAPATHSSDDWSSNSKLRLDFGKGTLRMREKHQLDLNVGGYKNSTGDSGVSVSGSVRVPTYINGLVDTDSSRGVYLDPGLSVRVDVGGDKDKKAEQVSLDASAGAIYRLQGIVGSDPKVASRVQRYQELLNDYTGKAALEKRNDKLDAEYDKKFAALGATRPDCRSYSGCPDPVEAYLEALRNYSECDTWCTSSRDALTSAREELERLGFPVPRYGKVHLTADVQFGKLGYRYRNAKALGLSQSSAMGDIAQASLHGAFTLNDVNIDLCALAGIGGVLGSFGDSDSTLETIAWQAHAKGCAGVQVGPLFNLHGEVGYERSFAPAVSDLAVQKFTVDGALLEIAGTPLGVGYTFEAEKAQTGDSGGKNVRTQLLSVRSVF